MSEGDVERCGVDLITQQADDSGSNCAALLIMRHLAAQTRALKQQPDAVTWWPAELSHDLAWKLNCAAARGSPPFSDAYSM